MKNLISILQNKGVQLLRNQQVVRFEKNNRKITKVLTTSKEYQPDIVVIATGAWSRELTSMLDHRLPMMPGRGYSVTISDEKINLNYPSILMEGRVALTPMNGKFRLGGTMEVTPTNTPPRMNRIRGILNAVTQFFPDFQIEMPTEEEIWYGYRPCSADGLPYIGRLKKLDNAIVATGHAMVGLTFGAGTGKLVAELASGKNTSMDIQPFSPARFS
jgi:D-amino-acid dehydrogenase